MSHVENIDGWGGTKNVYGFVEVREVLCGER